MDKRPLRVGLVLLPAALAIAAILLTACGGGDDRTKVEASLRHYLIHPHACINYRFCPQGAFPLGAGAPQVRENSCRKIHTGSARHPEGLPPARLPKGISGWSCDITFPPGKTALPVAVALKGNGEVYSAWPVSPHVALPPARVYQGGPEQPQP